MRERGICFHTAHAVAARVARAMKDDPACDLATALGAATSELAGERFDYPAWRLREILSPRHFVEVRTTPGGPAPAVAREALAVARQAIQVDRQWLEGRRAALSAAADRLRERSRQL